MIFALLFLLQIQNPLIDRLYSYSGLESRVANIPILITTQYEQQFAERPLSDAGKQRFQQLLKAFDADSMKRDAYVGLRKGLDRSRMRALETWLGTPKNTQIHELLKPALDEDMATRIDELFTANDSLLTIARIGIFNQLDERMRTSEIEAMVIVNVYLSFVTVMNPYLPEADRITDEEMPEISQLMFDDLYKAYEMANLGRMAYLLKDVSNEDLRRFSEGYTSDTGMWFADLGKSAMEHVLERIGARIDANL